MSNLKNEKMLDVSPDVRKRILRVLDEIEVAENVRILYACESGSRAWGFASKDSDYDVRFIYVRKLESYVSLWEPRDVIERPIVDDLDMAGWDLRKALGLFYKSNPSMLEWLDSPVVYRDDGRLAARLRELRSRVFSPVAAVYHYLNMAENQWRKYLQKPVVNRKKYLYAIRPMLACLWVLQQSGPVPTRFGTLLDELLPNGDVRLAVDALLRLKAAGLENQDSPADPTLQEWLSENLSMVKQQAGNVAPAADNDGRLLDELFRETVMA